MQAIIAKGLEFINGCVLLNKKNVDIVKMMGGILEFDRIRVESIEKILSNEMSKKDEKKSDGKYYLGARNLALVFHQKIRAKYAK